MLYCGNNLARQRLQGRLRKLSVWKKFNFNSWIEIHCFFQTRRALNWIKSMPLNSQWANKKSLNLFVSYLQLKKKIISHPLTIKTIQGFLLTRKWLSINWQQSFDDYLNSLLVLFILQQTPSWMFLLLYTFISFRASPAGAVSHCLPLSPWLMFTGHSNTLNSLVRKGKMGALAGVRYCRGKEGATSMGRQRNLASVW